ncbi:maleylpyruvate isomerase family mycothiol-dependent enzyme [Actinoplanes sp. KI2]|uniref:maleylpyruvate isomerase family mycothiol-dependent enzyme n=1 Tax=Actinoplanes sp. KI2 TaxID=2983315 RepID=UPI0021D60C05|nr:maleylpyruvate isomerase family mycothiol-dependent enzyme [Actinoplanes sp. KI2]MCU7723417.1 maleylpyruvate isomerase family mycothiol-dependent enzyme [Actinoplanes sp. KI2]
MTFDELLTLVDDRSAALRSAAAAASSLEARVPGCPDWALTDLIRHLGAVQRFWAVVVRLADASAPPTAEQRGDLDPQGDLLEWSAESTALLVGALRAAGPESAAWAWWGGSGTPLTAAAVARHQVQEAAVHAYDAQEAAGEPSPLPAAVAVDGVAEFLSVGMASLGKWPHRPARVAFTAIEGPSWVVDLSPAGVQLDPAAGGEPVTTVHGSASDLVLALYKRIPVDAVRVDGDRSVFDEMLGWSAAD